MTKDAYTIPEFCKRHGLSRGAYYLLRQRGQGPIEMRLGRSVRISVEAAEYWRRRMEEPSAEEAVA